MKILIITDKYYPKPLANAICVQKVADCFIRVGHSVDILAYRDTKIKGEGVYNNCNVYYITPDIRNRLYNYAFNFPDSPYAKPFQTIATFMNRLGKLIMLPFTPLYSFGFPLRLKYKIEQLHKTEKYDLIISVFQPFEAALAGYWFKKSHRDTPLCLYTLDTFINQKYSFLTKLPNRNQWLYKFLEKSDFFIYMRSRIKEYDKSWFAKWQNKMICADIPLMIPINNLKAKQVSTNIQWVYAGSLEVPHYQTDDLIKIFLIISKNSEHQLSFYARGVQADKLKSYEEKTKGKIQVPGYVSHNKLAEIYSEASILVSIKYTDQISAKIFEYMSYGKKIVHISGTPDDPNVEYLRHYSKAIILTPYKDSIEKCAEQLRKWLDSWTEEKENIPVDYSYFEMNKPEYTAKLILTQYGVFERRRNNEKIYKEYYE